MTEGYIDSHCHFDFDQFDGDRDELIERCMALGVCSLLMPGVNPLQWQKLKALCEPNGHQSDLTLYWSAGLHPWSIDSWVTENSTIKEAVRALEGHLNRTLAYQNCIAVGECGLDKRRAGQFDWQKQLLLTHIAASNRFEKPLILHCVKAHNDMLQILKSYPVLKGGVVHAFSGSLEIAEQYWRLGFRLGVGGVITYERARKTRLAIKGLPLDALLLETDAPDMPLAGRQGQRNSPEYIVDIARCLAALRDDSVDVIAAATTHNFKMLFGV